MIQRLTIATRGSKLALWQAEFIKKNLTDRYPGLQVELSIIKTTGDKILDVPLAKVGGKGLFVKEIEEALLEGRADLAVHSMKDVPAEIPTGLILGVIPERAKAYDQLLSCRYKGLTDLPKKARVGTSSLRRKSQLLALRPDLTVVNLRGNLDTRVRKLSEDQFDAIVVAAAGLDRLGLSASHSEDLAPPRFLPAVGQGALGIEYPIDRPDLEELLGFLDHAPTRFCVQAERGFLHELEGGCQVPIAGHACLVDGQLLLTGLVSDLSGQRVIRREKHGKTKDAETLGRTLAREILEAGGAEILREVYAAEE